MPTVLRQGGFAFRVLTLDHDPPHVHAAGCDGVVLVNIDSGTVRRVDGKVKQADISRARSIVAEHRALFATAWYQTRKQVTR
ncbi:MAG TPA: DUF4160 domain-containing protein [Longimicrobium sp.]|nr:DUF4160 domain-containing protein [Longimicrobium sp.]